MVFDDADGYGHIKSGLGRLYNLSAATPIPRAAC